MTSCPCFARNDRVVVVVVMSLWFGPPHRLKVAFVLTDKLVVCEFQCGHDASMKIVRTSSSIITLQPFYFVMYHHTDVAQFLKRPSRRLFLRDS